MKCNTTQRMYSAFFFGLRVRASQSCGVRIKDAGVLTCTVYTLTFSSFALYSESFMGTFVFSSCSPLFPSHPLYVYLPIGLTSIHIVAAVHTQQWD